MVIDINTRSKALTAAILLTAIVALSSVGVFAEVIEDKVHTPPFFYDWNTGSDADRERIEERQRLANEAIEILIGDLFDHNVLWEDRPAYFVDKYIKYEPEKDMDTAVVVTHDMPEDVLEYYTELLKDHSGYIEFYPIEHTKEELQQRIDEIADTLMEKGIFVRGWYTEWYWDAVNITVYAPQAKKAMRIIRKLDGTKYADDEIDVYVSSAEYDEAWIGKKPVHPMWLLPAAGAVLAACAAAVILIKRRSKDRSGNP